MSYSPHADGAWKQGWPYGRWRPPPAQHLLTKYRFHGKEAELLGQMIASKSGVLGYTRKQESYQKLMGLCQKTVGIRMKESRYLQIKQNVDSNLLKHEKKIHAFGLILQKILGQHWMLWGHQLLRLPATREGERVTRCHLLVWLTFQGNQVAGDGKFAFREKF